MKKVLDTSKRFEYYLVKLKEGVMKKALVIIISIAAIVLISLCIAWGAEYHLRGREMQYTMKYCANYSAKTYAGRYGYIRRH